MRKGFLAIVSIVSVTLLSVPALAQYPSGTGQYMVGTVSVTHSNATVSVGSFNSSTDTVVNGWIHVVATGIDAWVAVSSTASTNDIPAKKPPPDKYCEFASPCPQYRELCGTDETSCTLDYDIKDSNGNVIRTETCTTVCN